MKLACITFTAQGKACAESILKGLDEWEVSISVGFGEGKVSLRTWTQHAFEQAEAVVFVGASGIAVRAIAPYVTSKTTDPAVLVIDEGGSWIIPLLSGHIGGANRLATQLAKNSGATAVLTTATDVRGVWAVDEWATEQSIVIKNPRAIKTISSRLLKGEHVRLYSDEALEGAYPNLVVDTDDRTEADIVLSPYVGKQDKPEALRLIPVCMHGGIGCRKETSLESIESAYQQALEQSGIEEKAIVGVFSIDLKKNEKGLIAFCEKQGWPLSTYSADVLEKVEGSVAHSAFVKEITGVGNVCERSALADADALVYERQSFGAVTIAFAWKKVTYKFEDVI